VFVAIVYGKRKAEVSHSTAFLRMACSRYLKGHGADK